MLSFLLEYLDRDTTSEELDLVFGVISALLNKLCFHVGGSSFVSVSNELFTVLHSVVKKYTDTLGKKPSSDVEDSSVHAIVKMLKLVVQAASFRSGSLFKHHTGRDLRLLGDSLSTLCGAGCFVSLSARDQCVLVKLLCQLWTSLPRQESLHLVGSVREILERGCQKIDSLPSISTILAKELLPLLEDESEREAVTSSLVASAVKLVESDADATLEVVFTIVSSGCNLSNDTGATSGRVDFDLFRCRGCSISRGGQEALYDACLQRVEEDIKNDQAVYSRVLVALRCAPFLATSCANNKSEMYRKASTWMLDILDAMSTKTTPNGVLAQSLAVESFSFLSLEALESGVSASAVEKKVLRVKPFAAKLALSHGASLWGMRGAASTVPLLERFGLSITDEPDAVFDALTPNLRSSNHFLRLYTLQILSSFPMKTYVVDHADLDLSGDLDEDESFRPAGGANLAGGSGPVGQCDLLQVLLKLESSPVRLTNERELVSLIEKVEVRARTARLPVVYAEAAANHMLGVLHIKFAPLWPAAQKTIVALATAYESAVWPSFEAELVAVMSWADQKEESSNVSTGGATLSFYDSHFERCKEWELSEGQNVVIFGSNLGTIEGEVPCYQSTDRNTVMESVWKAAELGHKIVVRHSRSIVPLFLGFLHNQLFAFHSNDQDARELHLDAFVETKR
jgi:hypothetical protein